MVRRLLKLGDKACVGSLGLLVARCSFCSVTGDGDRDRLGASQNVDSHPAPPAKIANNALAYGSGPHRIYAAEQGSRR